MFLRQYRGPELLFSMYRRDEQIQLAARDSFKIVPDLDVCTLIADYEMDMMVGEKFAQARVYEIFKMMGDIDGHIAMLNDVVAVYRKLMVDPTQELNEIHDYMWRRMMATDNLYRIQEQWDFTFMPKRIFRKKCKKWCCTGIIPSYKYSSANFNIRIMSFTEINPEKLQFNRFTKHNPGHSIATKQRTKFITPWVRVSSYPKSYVALKDKAGNAISRASIYNEVTDKQFINWIKKLEERCQHELVEQKVDPDPEKHWNDLLVSGKFLRVKVHVRPNGQLQLYAYPEGSDTDFKIDMKDISKHFYTDVVVRYILEIRPVIFKNGRAGTTLKVDEVEFRKDQKKISMPALERA